VLSAPEVSVLSSPVWGWGCGIPTIAGSMGLWYQLSDHRRRGCCQWALSLSHVNTEVNANSRSFGAGKTASVFLFRLKNISARYRGREAEIRAACPWAWYAISHTAGTCRGIARHGRRRALLLYLRNRKRKNSYISHLRCTLSGTSLCAYTYHWIYRLNVWLINLLFWHYSMVVLSPMSSNSMVVLSPISLCSSVVFVDAYAWCTKAWRGEPGSSIEK